MAELSKTPGERSRKAYARVLQSMQDAGTQRNAAQILGVSEATISRIKTEKLEDAITLLYLLDWKIVPQTVKCYPVEYVDALHTLARVQMAEKKSSLEWEE